MGFVFLLASNQLQANKFKSVPDSLNYIVKTGNTLAKIDAYNNLFSFYIYKDFILAKSFAYKAYNLALKSKNELSLANCINNLASIMSTQGETDKALLYYLRAKKIFIKLNVPERIAAVEYNIGDIYQEKAEYKTAIEYFFRALKMDEKLNNESGMAFDHSVIGTSYYYMKKIELAFEQYQLALNLFLKIKDFDGIARSYSNIAVTKDAEGKIEEAISFYLKSLEIHTKLQNKGNIANCYNSLGGIYAKQNKIVKAKEYFTKYLDVATGYGDKREMAIAYLNLGSLSRQNKRNLDAIDYFKKGLELSLNFGQVRQDLFKEISAVYEEQNDLQNALINYKQYVSMHDSIFNTANNNIINELQTKYKSELKDKALLKKDAEIKQEKLTTLQHATQRNAFIIGFGVLFILAAFIFRGYRQKKKNNAELEEKNKVILLQSLEVQTQRDLLEEKQTEILDSIHYAKRIQEALLPSQKYFERVFKKLNKN